MPQILVNKYPIWIEIPNRTIAGTEYKQKVLVVDLDVNYHGERVVVDYQLHPFAKNADDSYGDHLAGQFNFEAKPGRFIADNSTIVSVTGKPLASILSEVLTEEGRLAPEAVIRRFDTGETTTIAGASHDVIPAVAEVAEVLDPETGEVVVPYQPAQPERPAGPFFGDPVYFREWDFYFHASENEQVVVGQLIRNTFQNGLEAGRV